MSSKSRFQRFLRLCSRMGLGAWIVGFCSVGAEEASPDKEKERRIRDCIETVTNLSNPMMVSRNCIEEVLRRYPREALEPFVRAARDAKEPRAKLRLLQQVDRILTERPIETPEDGAKIFSTLSAMTAENEFAVRYWVVKALGGIPTEEALRALSRLLEEPDDKQVLHVQIIYSMGRTGYGDSELVRRVRHKDALIREAICDALVSYRTVPALTCMFRGLYDKDIRVRSAAITGLKFLNADGELGYFPGSSDEERRGPLKAWFDWMLKLGDVPFRPEELTEFFDAPHPEVREKICQALREPKSGPAFRCLLWGLADPEESVRRAAIESLKSANKGADLGFNPAGAEENREKPARQWADWARGQKAAGLAELDWFPVFQASPGQVKFSLLELLRGVRTRSAGLCIYYGLLDKSLDVRRQALEAFKSLSGGKDLDYKPDAKVEDFRELAQPISNWLAEHKAELHSP
ncbi:MAG: hypothetical protein HYU36_06340 [Planctomycetes bacterium]|nr:hypothetical protein [Planctomycetota bacterium]